MPVCCLGCGQPFRDENECLGERIFDAAITLGLSEMTRGRVVESETMPGCCRICARQRHGLDRLLGGGPCLLAVVSPPSLQAAAARESGEELVQIVGSKQVRRYRIGFEKPEYYERALRQCGRQGFIVFSDGQIEHLIGVLVRWAPRHLLIEVDAAEDIGALQS